MEKRRAALQQAFRLDEATAKAALATADIRATSPGDVVVAQGEPTDTVFVITRGRFEVDVRTDGRVQPVRMLGPGRFFGEMALLDGAPRVASVTSRTEGEVIVLTGDTLGTMLEQAPGARHAFAAEVAERRDQLERSTTH